MSALTRLTGATLAAVLLGLILSPAPVAAGDPTTVTVDAPAQVGAGVQFTVRVNVTGVTDFDACNYDVTYDPSMIEIVGDEGGAEGITPGLIGATGIPITVWGFVPAETPGIIRVIQNVPGTAGATGSGYLATIHFRVKTGASGLSAINISNGCLSDKDAGAMSATWNSDSVTIEVTPTALPDATPTLSPDATPAAPPDVTPGALPDATLTASLDVSRTDRTAEIPYTYTPDLDSDGVTESPAQHPDNTPSPSPASAQASAMVSIEAPAHVTPGSDFVARVAINGVTDFDACNYDVIYDPSVLEIIGDEGGTDGVIAGFIGATEIPIDLWGFVPSGTPGKIRVIQNVPGVAGVSGSGHLAALLFHVIGESGTSSVITLENGCLSNKDAQQIPASWIGVSVLCVSAEAMAPSSSLSAASPSPPAPSQLSNTDNAGIPLIWLTVALGGAAIVAGSIVILRRALRGQQSP